MGETHMVRAGAISALLAVMLGAFGAHSLEARLIANDTLDVWKTASHYHLIHSLAMLLPWSHTGKRIAPVWLFALGVLIFSGSLYLLCITGQKWLGAITPIGGLSFMAGWLLIALRAGKQK